MHVHFNKLARAARQIEIDRRSMCFARIVVKIVRDLEVAARETPNFEHAWLGCWRIDVYLGFYLDPLYFPYCSMMCHSCSSCVYIWCKLKQARRSSEIYFILYIIRELHRSNIQHEIWRHGFWVYMEWVRQVGLFCLKMHIHFSLTLTSFLPVIPYKYNSFKIFNFNLPRWEAINYLYRSRQHKIETPRDIIFKL